MKVSLYWISADRQAFCPGGIYSSSKEAAKHQEKFREELFARAQGDEKFLEELNAGSFEIFAVSGKGGESDGTL